MESKREKFKDQSLRYALNPLYRMRRDLDRVFIFPLNPFTCPETNRRIFINPVEAIIISLFNGKRNVGEVSDDIAYLLDCGWGQAEAIAVNCLVKYSEIMIRVSESNKNQIVQYEPHEFVIAKSKVDLITDRPKIPEVIMFIPTFACDLHCAYCYAPRNAKHHLTLDFFIVDRFLQQMQKWMLPALFLSGGDPFNYRYIKELIIACNKKEIKPIIPTKSPLTGEMIDFVVNNKIDEMQFSIDTIQGNISQLLIGRDQDYLTALINSIEEMIKNGVRLNTNTVVTAYNIKSLPDLIENMATLGVKQMNFSQYARSQYRHNDALFCTPDELHILYDQINDYRNKYPSMKLYFKYIKDHTLMDRLEKEEFFKKMPVCTAGKMGMVILPDGSVTVCENLYYQNDLLIGDLKRQSLEEIWFSRRRMEIVEQGDKFLAAGNCGSCADAIPCYRQKGKCFVRALQAFGNIRMPDPYCPETTGGARIV